MKKIILILAILFSSTAYSAELPDGFYRLEDSSREGLEIPYMFKENASEFLDPNDLFIEGKELTYRVEEKILPAKPESYIQELQQALPGKFTSEQIEELRKEKRYKSIILTFSNTARKIMAEETKKRIDKRIAWVHNSQIVGAPTVKEPVDRQEISVFVEDTFSQKEIEDKMGNRKGK